MNRKAKWICAPIDTEQAGIAFVRTFDATKAVKKATLSVSAIGLYAVLLHVTERLCIVVGIFAGGQDPLTLFQLIV